MVIPSDQPSKFREWWSEQGLRKPNAPTKYDREALKRRSELDAELQRRKEEKELEG